MSPQTSTANLPVAEAVYPPGGRPKDPAEIVGPILLIGAIVLVLAVVGMVAFGSHQRQTQRLAVEQQLAERASEFASRQLSGPMGHATARRLGHLALFTESSTHERERPTIPDEGLQLRIVAVHTRPLDVVVRDAEYPQLVFVGYEALRGVGPSLPDSRAIDTATLAIRERRSTNDPRYVTLVHWSADSRGGNLRVLPIDFSDRADVGVAFSAIDAPTQDHAVAFALGDPVTGDGVYLSEWATVPPLTS